MKCRVCGAEAEVSLRSHNAAFCRDCFLAFFRRQVEKGIKSRNLFTHEDRILVALSGGKDSLGLFLELYELGYNVSGLFVDLAIPESSDSARKAVEKFCSRFGLDLLVVDLAREGLPIPEVKRALKRPVCSACGQIKRYYFNKAAVENGFSVLATGHNLDDETARLFSNVLRWDGSYLASQTPALEARPGYARKVKPLWRLSEFETANYAFLRGIEHHWQSCPYSPGASFSVLKGLLQKLEAEMPGRKLDFYQGFLERGRSAFQPGQAQEPEETGSCAECGSPASQGSLCSVCRIKSLLGGDGKAKE